MLILAHMGSVPHLHPSDWLVLGLLAIGFAISILVQARKSSNA